MAAWAHRAEDGRWIISLHITPGAGKNAVAGERDGRLWIKLAARAADNQANTALLKFLATQLAVAKTRLELLKGNTSRQKLVAAQPEAVPERLLENPVNLLENRIR